MTSAYMLITIFYILGIFVSHLLDLSALFFLATGVGIVSLFRTATKGKANLKILLLAAIMLFGGLRYFQATENELYRQFPEKYVSVTGTIYSPSQPTSNNSSYRYTLMLDSVSYYEKTISSDDMILLYSKEQLAVGTKIVASGFLTQISEINNEYEFDYSTYSKGFGIFAQLSARCIKVTGKEYPVSLPFFAGLLSDKVSSETDTHFDGNSGAFLKAILTGNMGGFSKDYLNLLINTGVYRLLYSPFIHVSLIFFVAGALFRNKNSRNGAILIALIVYAVFNVSSPTIIKSAVVCGLFLFKKQIFGYADKFDILLKVLFAIVIINPLLCFHSGFVLSVASSVLLYFSYRPLYSCFLGSFYKHRVKLAPFLSKTLSLWVILLLGTLPFCAYFFNGISVYAIIFSVLAMPVIMVILALSPFMLLSFDIFGASPVLGFIVNKLVDFIAFLPEIAKRLPAYYICLSVPSTTEIVIYSLTWSLFILGAKRKLKTAKATVLITVICGIIVSGALFIKHDTLSIHFVNVGQGDGAVLKTSAGETVLIDGGGSGEYEKSYNTGEQVFVPYLTSHGIFEVDVAILSHCHKDHAEGIIAAAENIDINTIVLPPTSLDNEWHQKLLQVAKEKDIEVQYLSCGDEICFNSGLNIDFIAPNGYVDDLNKSSLVAHITYGEFDALFTGDSDNIDCSIYPENVDLLKVSHHGSSESTSKAFVEKVGPKYAVISVGEDNTFNFPSRTVLKYLNDSGAKILRTDKMGNIKIDAKKNGEITYRTLRGD